MSVLYSKPTPVLAGDELQVNPGGARARGAGDTGSLPATCQTTVAGQDPKRSMVLQSSFCSQDANPTLTTAPSSSPTPGPLPRMF